MFPSFVYTPLKLVSIAPKRIYHAEYCILNCNAGADPGGEPLRRKVLNPPLQCITIIHVLVPMKLMIALYIMAITSLTNLYSLVPHLKFGFSQTNGVICSFVYYTYNWSVTTELNRILPNDRQTSQFEIAIPSRLLPYLPSLVYIITSATRWIS